MKTQISITGQIGGNHKLYNALGPDGMLGKKYQHQSIIVEYRTKKDATRALSNAYQSMTRSEPGIKNKIGGINYSYGSHLNYDASRAVIL